VSSTIRERQNEPESLRLLEAQRQLYSYAKRLGLGRAAIALVLAIVGIAAVAQHDLEVWIGFFGVLWLAVDEFAARRWEVSRVKLAASIQEEFDVHVLALPRNARIQRPRREDVYAASHRLCRRDGLRDWYGDPGTLLGRLSTLLCMRSNVVWDSRLRRTYPWTLMAVTVLWPVAIAIFGIVVRASFTEIILILVPSASLIVQNIRTIRAHFEVATTKDAAEAALLALWQTGLRSAGTVMEGDLRHLQDEIYRSRTVIAQVPDFIYWRQRKQQEQNMRHTLNQFKAEAEAVVDSQLE
jgi:hypothetical protein